MLGTLSSLVHLVLLGAFALAFLVQRDALAQGETPGSRDPIVPAARRTLFADQHALLAMPQNPATLSPPSTFTDWMRNGNLSALQLGAIFSPALQGTTESRAAAGHIENQEAEQVAVARFVGSGVRNEIQVDVLAPNGTTVPGYAATLESASLGSAYGVPVPESFDVATGKLSPQIDEEGIEHDEVVVCSFVERNAGTLLDPLLFVKVTVLDYTDVTTLGVIETSFELPTLWNLDTIKPLALDRGADTLIACETGDLDGDGVDEAVVAFYFNGAVVQAWEYTNDGETEPSLALRGQIAQIPPLRNQLPGAGSTNPQYFGSIDVATGDFDADGRLEIALSTVNQQEVFQSSGTFALSTYPGIRIVSADSNLNLALESRFAEFEPALTSRAQFGNGTGSYACRPNPSPQACETTRARVVSGLFKFHPPTGYQFDRRQLAVVYNTSFSQGGGLRAQALDVSADLRTIRRLGDPVALPQQSCDTSFCPSAQRFSVGAGGLIGAADTSRPEWSLAVTNWEATRNGAANGSTAGQFHTFWVQAKSVDADGNGGGLSKVWDAVQLSQQVLSGPSTARLPAVAWDREGAGLYLGSPVQLTVYDLVQTQYVVEEPPKHAYWWPPTATTAAEGEVLNVSRKDGFFVRLEDEQSRDFSQTSRDTTDWSIGGSLAVSAKASVTKGKDIAIVKTQATGSIEVNAKVGYDYDENKDAYEMDYRSQTTTFTGSTNRDDLLIAELQTFDVWRYPITGISLQDGLNPFWEIAFPGEIVTVQGGGLNFDWFTPPYENGNVLSYPRLMGNSFTPADCCAPFTFVENGREVTKAIPFLDNRLLAFDGTGATIDLRFSQSAGQGESKSYSHTLSASLDVKVGYKTKTKTPGFSVDAETSATASISNTNSWSTMSTTDATTNTSTGFKLNKPAGNPNQSYLFAPAFYLAEDGTTKVSSAVDVLGTGSTFWPQTYGSLPDPALKLPRRFSPLTISETQTIWIPNLSDDAKRIRGFTPRFAVADSGGFFPPTGGAVPEGERVRLEVEVHNYSVGQGFAGLPVRFEIAAYDPLTNAEGPREPLVCGAGSVLTLALDPLGRANTVCVWNTTGFGPGVPGALQSYRVYVILDPADQLAEIYDGTAGPGQNNEGWGLVAVADPRLTEVLPTATADVPRGGDVRLVEDALRLQVDGQIESGFARVVALQNTPLQVCIECTQTLTGDHHVLVWNGDPAAGGVLLADKILPGIDRGGDECVWITDFRLEEPGDTTLYARVLEARDDGEPGNAVDALRVWVDPVPAPAPGRFRGEAGLGSPQGMVRLVGSFPLVPRLDLSLASVTVLRVLGEAGGAGELVPAVEAASGQPPTLGAKAGGQTNRAAFETPPGLQPRIRVELRAAATRLQVSLEVHDAEVLSPASCGDEAELSTELLVLDGEKAPVSLQITAPWRCVRGPGGAVRRLVLAPRAGGPGRHAIRDP